MIHADAMIHAVACHGPLGVPCKQLAAPEDIDEALLARLRHNHSVDQVHGHADAVYVQPSSPANSRMHYRQADRDALLVSQHAWQQGVAGAVVIPGLTLHMQRVPSSYIEPTAMFILPCFACCNIN